MSLPPDGIGEVMVRWATTLESVVLLAPPDPSGVEGQPNRVTVTFTEPGWCQWVTTELSPVGEKSMVVASLVCHSTSSERLAKAAWYPLLWFRLSICSNAGRRGTLGKPLSIEEKGPLVGQEAIAPLNDMAVSPPEGSGHLRTYITLNCGPPPKS